MVPSTGETFHEISILDAISANANVVLGYILRKGEDSTFDTSPLVHALERVTEKWKLLSGRVVRDKKTKKYLIRVSSGEPCKPTFKFTSTTYNHSIKPPSLARSSVTPRPNREYFYDSSTASTLGQYASHNNPLISLHVSHLSDATCIGLSISHGLFDAIGAGFIVQALDAELAGRDWTPPPLESHNLVNTAFLELLKSPDMTEPTPTATNFEKMWVPFGLGKALKFLATIGYEYVFHKTVVKSVFLDKAVVDRLISEVKEHAKSYGTDKWVSTGDIILAWFLKAAMANDKDLPTISVAIAISFRKVLATMNPGFETYPHNCMAVCPMPNFSSSWLKSATIAEVALSHRDHIEQVRKLSFIQSLACYFETLKGTAPIPDRSFEKPSFMLSNQVIGDLTNISFGPGTQLEAFWEWSIPVNANDMGIINKVKGGYSIMVTMRKSRWDSIEKEIERINGGGSFT